MNASRLRRLVYALIILALAVVLALYGAARLLKTQIEAALGADSQVDQIRLLWNRVEIDRLRIKGPPGWPAADALRAEQVVLYPDLGGLLQARIRIASIQIDRAYLSALRTADGQLKVVPGLLERRAAKGVAPPLPVDIGEIELHDAALEFFDASVRQPPLRIRLDPLQIRLGKLTLPALGGRTSIALAGILQGPQSDGSINVSGWLAPASKDLEISTQLQGVDLVALEPYLVTAAHTHVKKGTFDLRMQSTVQQRRLHAPGIITLNHLQLGAGEDWLGLPRQALLRLSEDRQEKIVVHFELNGDLNDPKFKLNENIATRFTAGLADSLGLSVEGIVSGAGSLGQKSVEAVGGAFRKLFGHTQPSGTSAR